MAVTINGFPTEEEEHNRSEIRIHREGRHEESEDQGHVEKHGTRKDKHDHSELHSHGEGKHEEFGNQGLFKKHDSHEEEKVEECPKICDAQFEPVCGHIAEGKHERFENKCHFEKHACENGLGMQLLEYLIHLKTNSIHRLFSHLNNYRSH